MKTIKITHEEHDIITNTTTCLIDICNYDLVKVSEGEVTENYLEVDKERIDKLLKGFPKLTKTLLRIGLDIEHEQEELF